MYRRIVLMTGLLMMAASTLLAGTISEAWRKYHGRQDGLRRYVVNGEIVEHYDVYTEKVIDAAACPVGGGHVVLATATQRWEPELAAGGYFTGNFIEIVDWVVFRTDDDGNLSWALPVADAERYSFSSITAVADGDFLVAGSVDAPEGQVGVLAKVSSAGELIGQVSLDGFGGDVHVVKVFEDREGALSCAGSITTRTSGANSDVVVFRLNPDGGLRCFKRHGTQHNETTIGFHRLPGGGFGLVANTDDPGEHDVLVLWMDEEGVPTRHGFVQGDGEGVATSSVVTDDGGVITAGYSYMDDGTTNTFVMKLDNQGLFSWCTRAEYMMPDLLDARFESISLDTDGSLILAGSTESAGGRFNKRVALVGKLDRERKPVWGKLLGIECEGDKEFVKAYPDGAGCVVTFGNTPKDGTPQVAQVKLCEVGTVLPLTLTSMCSHDPSVRRWRITNPNPFRVSADWEVYGTAQQGTIVAGSGETFFTTESVSGPNTTIIQWVDEQYQEHRDTKASSGALCD